MNKINIEECNENIPENGIMYLKCGVCEEFFHIFDDKFHTLYCPKSKRQGVYMDFKKKHRMKGIENAMGFSDFYKSLRFFMEGNNFREEEIKCIMHALNSFYFLGDPLEID